MTKPRTRTTWTTPVGVFPSATQACAALKCDRTTLYNRVEKGVEGYGRSDREIVPMTKPRAPKPVKLPFWGEYRFMPFEEKERIYRDWCKLQKMDPEDEYTANLFFDDMDSLQPAETAQSA